MVVAIDGPAGCGKSTVAKILAERLHLTFLNSGSFYRGITLALLRAGIDLKDEQKIICSHRHWKLWKSGCKSG